ncbi:class II aldolase/adducin family protein [Chelativorans sp. ZYF759]|jgi:hypothetical protein|uniref:class II aldolase/adducin family protein n=1 Tax=Chelativorans sp. ZYF759 TaxID=2692213 RepID=UPI001AEEEF8C|nr:class II aldolase/adducin family protein [Chelativorans sp. ZYF759]
MTEAAASNTDQSVIEATITNLFLANRILAREDVIDDFGHVSVRNPLNPDHYFLSRSRSPAVVTRADIMEFTLDGETVGDDTRRPYAERHIHGAIYKDRPDVNAVTHHHARSVIPFTMVDVSLRPVFHMASVIGEQMNVWDSQDEFGDRVCGIGSAIRHHGVDRAEGQCRPDSGDAAARRGEVSHQWRDREGGQDAAQRHAARTRLGLLDRTRGFFGPLNAAAQLTATSTTPAIATMDASTTRALGLPSVLST